MNDQGHHTHAEGGSPVNRFCSIFSRLLKLFARLEFDAVGTRGIGYRYRLDRADLPGKPDLAFIGRRKVIFVHGCFWHAHASEFDLWVEVRALLVFPRRRGRNRW
jgi:DNA mismatch endonuclease Vsr